MQKLGGIARDTAGNSLAGTTVTVYLTGTLTLASIFSDNGITPKANPFTGNADGSYFFYAANGRYDLVLTKTSFGFNNAVTADELFNDVLDAQVNAYESRGLVGNPNVGTPNSQYDLKADAIVLRSPSTGGAVVRTAVTTVTNNVLSAGPAAGGRDQVGAFGASNWIHFYFIWNGAVVSTVSSLTPPPVGPVLPTGYTHWCYAGAVFYDAAPILRFTVMGGNRAHYTTPLISLSAGQSNVATQVTMTTAVPPNAVAMRLWLLTVADYSVAAGNLLGMLSINNSVTTNNFMMRVDAVSTAINLEARDSQIGDIPGVTLWYIATPSGNTFTGAAGVYAFTLGYVMPNGGE